MISVEEALHLVLQHKATLAPEEVPLSQALDRVLAQEVLADRDFPPFDRVTMDGIALRAEEVQAGTTTFHVTGVQAAGAPGMALGEPGTCLEVMTGAMLPQGATAVVPYESCSFLGHEAYILAEQVLPGQNIHKQGSDSKAGEVVVTRGTRITSAVVSALATEGRAQVQVLSLPRVAICSTGDELVPIAQHPLPHQIRQSNGFMLAAALQEENITASLYHLPDSAAEMKESLVSILQEHEVVLLSGAVSKGKFDFLPQVLEELGLQLVFHKIAQKPGKPMLFGTMPGQRVVFGFPGNPVSTFVCYHLYFKPWLQASLGLPTAQAWAQLDQDVSFKPALTYHLPVVLHNQSGCLRATPVTSTGSGDLTSLLKATAYLSLPAHQTTFREGEVFPVTLI